MTACPMHERLACYLAGPAAVEEVQAIEKHVETCSACKAQLQQLVENGANGHAIGARKRKAHPIRIVGQWMGDFAFGRAANGVCHRHLCSHLQLQ